MGIQDRVGRIAPGQLADLVLLEANPLEDIRNTRRILGVISQGRYRATEQSSPRPPGGAP